MNVKSKLILVLSLLVVVLTATGGATFLKLNALTPKLHQIDEDANLVSESWVPLLLATAEVKSDVYQVWQWLTDISATRGLDGLDDGFEQAQANAEKFAVDLEKTRALATSLNLTGMLATLDEIEAAFEPFYATGKKMAQAYVADGPAGGNKMMAEFDTAAESIANAVEKMITLAQDQSGQSVASLKQQADAIETVNANLVRLISVLAIAGVIVALAGAYYLYRLIGSSLKALLADVGIIAGADGDTAMRLNADRADEFGEVARALAKFRAQLAEVDRLRADQEQAKQAAEQEKHNAMMALADQFDAGVGKVVETVASTSHRMHESAATMTSTAEETNRQSTIAASSTEQAASNVQTVAAAAEQLSSSISEISRQVIQSSEIAANAVVEAKSTNKQIVGLNEASQKIGEVVELITDIANQTNLLALNATIEAARAGEAGKGFAVVASEVKNLANQTANATQEIGTQIGEIQGATQEAVRAIEGISTTIGEINQIAASISAAVEEQGAATREIARNVEQASNGTEEVTRSINSVTKAAGEAGDAASDIHGGVGELADLSTTLKSEVDKFLAQVRVA